MPARTSRTSRHSDALPVGRDLDLLIISCGKWLSFCTIGRQQPTMDAVMFVRMPIRYGMRFNSSPSLGLPLPVEIIVISVPSRRISEGAAPCPYCLAPCPIYTAPCPNIYKNYFIILLFLYIFFFLQNVIDVFVFADLWPCFHQSPTKLCPDLVSFACWIVTKFWSFTRKSRLGHSRSNLCPILGRLRTKLCPNFGR